MVGYVLRRAAYGILLAVATGSAVFLILIGTGDPAGRVRSGNDITAGASDRMSDEFHLESPLARRFVLWVGDVATGELGTSAATNRPVSSTLWSQFAATAGITVISALTAALLGVLLGTGSRAGPALCALCLVGASLPVFAWALLAESLPTGGLPPALAAGTALVVVAGSSLGLLERRIVTRYMDSDAALWARASGLPSRRVVWRHALSSSLAPLLRNAGLGVGLLIGLVVTVEVALDAQGLGSTFARAVSASDVPLVLGSALALLLLATVLRIGVDVVAGFLDPDVRHQAR